MIDEAVGASDYLAGDALSIADRFLLPNLLFFGLPPEGAEVIAEARGAIAWLGRMRERASYRNSPMSRVFDVMSQLSHAAKRMGGDA
jgi:glutathione S-transferase